MRKLYYKSQAAFEFLTTYAWAFLAIMLTIGALYYFGVFDFSKFLPEECLFPSQFECLDFSFIDNELKLKLVNNIGEPIDIKSFTITNDASNPLSCLLPPLIADWQPGDEKDFTFGSCTGGVFIVGERVEAIITMEYCAPATTGCTATPIDPLTVHKINGKITATVNPP